MTPYNPPFVILIPKPDTWAARWIKAGSGIVGADHDENTYVVSYEGNLYGAINLLDWKDRVIHAADRLETGYPTVARGVMDKSQFEVIGTIEHCPMSRAWKITTNDPRAN